MGHFMRNNVLARELTPLSCTEKEARWARWNLRKKWGLMVTEGARPRRVLRSSAALCPSEKASLLPQLAVLRMSLHPQIC